MNGGLDSPLSPPPPSSTSMTTEDMASRTNKHGHRKPWIETPLVESAVLSKKAGCRIFLKLENLQPGGSFKSRAMGSLILHHIQNPQNANRQLHFFINSGGNAGLAAVCAARSLSYPCTVVLPLTTSRLMVDKLRAAGATQVIQYGDTIAAAGDYMREVVMKKDSELSPDEEQEGRDNNSKQMKKIALHPFDHEAIWDGNSSIIDELAYQLPAFEEGEGYLEGVEEEEETLPVDALICSVGGGGLMNGLVQGIERHRTKQQKKSTKITRRKDIHILAVETDGTQSMNLAMSAGALVTLPKITSMAVSLACVRVSEQTFEYCVSPPPGVVIHSAVLSDADAARGCLRLADDERILVELACGVCIEAAIGDGNKRKRSISLQHHSRGEKRAKAVANDEGFYGEDDDDTGLNVSCSDSGIASDAESDIMLTSSCLKQLVPGLTRESRVVIVVCGGSNVTTGMASEWREKLANGWD
ncbi:hypothetical protein UA08_00153 [Talaromyces atroroseus]|uniref:L-serine ammonia-lyase n=1 Tax=Talaromyces atroroseus TaxID=1441469 RepID=A0A225ASX9_TALAT|nr:hypothetical protein UA08_00153 [Talaromyces atroroseus]OKL64692.1 hypothetical protein UA08_00153 [Talaromyces atroroseus]